MTDAPDKSTDAMTTIAADRDAAINRWLDLQRALQSLVIDLDKRAALCREYEKESDAHSYDYCAARLREMMQQ